MSSSTLVCAVPAELPKAAVSTGAITDALCGRKPAAEPSEPASDQNTDTPEPTADARKRAAAQKLAVVRADRPATEAALTPPATNAGGVTRTGALTRTGAALTAEPTPGTDAAPTGTTDPTKDPAWAEALAKARAVPRTRDVITTGDAEGLRKAMLEVVASDGHMQRYMRRTGITQDELAGVLSRALFKGAVAGPNNQFAVPIPDNPGLIWEMSRHERREFQRSRREAALAADAASVVAQTELANLRAAGYSEAGAVQRLAGEVRSAATALHEFHRGGPLAEYYPAFSRDTGGAEADRAIRTAARDSGYARDAWEDPVYDDEVYESELPPSLEEPMVSEHAAEARAGQQARVALEQRAAAARADQLARHERHERDGVRLRVATRQALDFAALSARQQLRTATGPVPPTPMVRRLV